MRHTNLGQPEKSAAAEHRLNTGRNIHFKSISIPDKATGYMDYVTNEAAEIRLHSTQKNFNRDSGFTLSWSWYPVIFCLHSGKGT
jgi:hypothetical protein